VLNLSARLRRLEAVNGLCLSPAEEERLADRLLEEELARRGAITPQQREEELQRMIKELTEEGGW